MAEWQIKGWITVIAGAIALIGFFVGTRHQKTGIAIMAVGITAMVFEVFILRLFT